LVFVTTATELEYSLRRVNSVSKNNKEKAGLFFRHSGSLDDFSISATVSRLPLKLSLEPAYNLPSNNHSTSSLVAIH